MLSMLCRRRESINRNILECKGRWTSFWKGRESVLIETYWNVKGQATLGSSFRFPVLIETYWNVKHC